ncbi:MAG: ABC transporter ATP-binding protein [Oscillospiraceae bacterium]|nr:ABC transporter ATP-binding protein [Oscillospiraceae bacterium]
MITVEHLTKCYGNFTAVDDLSFEIDEGHVYGFLGPNGAGKTTTMNIMTGCLSATAGTVLIDGHDIFDEPNEAKKLIGYLPEQPPLYLNETPEEYLRFVGEAKGIKGAELKRQVEEVMEQTKITEMRNRRISALSKGYKQRVGIAQALLGDPKVIILDEPTVGLDPIQIIEIRDLIKELGQHHTVIFSSHILSEVQTICDEILIIAHGKLVALGEPEKLMHTLLTPNEITLTAEAKKQKVEEILAGLSGITELTYPEKQESEAYTTVHIKTDMKEIYDMSRQLFKAFVDNDIVLLEMALKQVNLEDVFIELTEDTAPENTEATEETEHEAPETSETTDEKSEESEVEADDSSTEA